MLDAGMLKSEMTINVSKKIICSFVQLMRFINENKDIFKDITIVGYRKV